MKNIYFRVFKNNSLSYCCKFDTKDEFDKELLGLISSIGFKSGFALQLFVDEVNPDLVDEFSSVNLFIKDINKE